MPLEASEIHAGREAGHGVMRPPTTRWRSRRHSGAIPRGLDGGANARFGESMPRRISLLYLGRRGALPTFTLELSRALVNQGHRVQLLLSEMVAHATDFMALDADTSFLPTFSRAHGAISQVAKLPRLRARTDDLIRAFEPEVVIETMAHVWSPALESVLKKRGVPRATIIHDARAHPGDPTALVTDWLVASSLRADRIVTLSRHVAEQLASRRPDVTSLWHPDMPLGPASQMLPQTPLRVLTFGRLHAYKGLDLLVEGAELARASGAQFQLEVRGQGQIERLRARLNALGALVDAQWQSETDLSDALSRCHVVAATYREASQSGLIAVANAAQRPSLATPVGALPEQVRDGVTGLIAARPDARAIADCLVRLAMEPDLAPRLAQGLAQAAPGRSMASFVSALLLAVTR